MTSPSRSERARAFQSYSRTAAGIGITIGAVALFGWCFGIEILKTVLPGLVDMKANTALCLILSGISVLLLRVEPVSPARLRGAILSASVVLLVGGLTLVEYQFGLSVGIDQLFFTEATGMVGNSAPGRMASSTAMGLMLLALSLLFLDLKTRRGDRPAQFAAIAAMTIGVFGVFAYCIDFKALYYVQSFVPMALHTAIAFLALCFAVLFARPTAGFMAIVTGDGLGCTVARRLSVAAIIVPFGLAWLRRDAERAHYFSAAFGVALLATSNVVIFLALIWWCALSLNRIDAKGKRGAQRLAAEYAVRGVLTESATLSEAQPKILRCMGESLGWDVGIVWELSRLDLQLHPSLFWSAGGEQVNDFEETTRHTTFGAGIGLPGRAWKENKPVWIANVLKDDRLLRAVTPADHALRSAFAFPIVTGDESTCVFELYSRDLQPLDDALLFMLDSIAIQISQFTQRVRVQKDLREANEKLAIWVKDLERHGNEITLLNQLGSVLQSCLTFSEAAKVIAKFGPELFPQTSGGAFVIAASRNMVESVAQWGDSPAGKHVFAPADCWALRSGRPNSAVSLKSPTLCPHASPTNAASFLCVPMMAQSESLGVLHLQWGLPIPEAMGDASDRDTTSKHQLALAVAEHIGLALANLRLRDALREQSIRDPLTNFYNRRHMEESLQRELLRATRNGGRVGAIMLDIDHFKRYNDTFGHEAGDTVLRELGMFIISQIRGEDIACRYGGEEFMLILPDATLEIARKRADKLCEGVKHLHITHHGQSLGVITLSLGVSAFPDHGNSVATLVNAADEALYMAKKRGRNQVVTWNSLPEPACQTESLLVDKREIDATA